MIFTLILSSRAVYYPTPLLTILILDIKTLLVFIIVTWNIMIQTIYRSFTMFYKRYLSPCMVILRLKMALSYQTQFGILSTVNGANTISLMQHVSKPWMTFSMRNLVFHVIPKAYIIRGPHLVRGFYHIYGSYLLHRKPDLAQNLIQPCCFR